MLSAVGCRLSAGWCTGERAGATDQGLVWGPLLAREGEYSLLFAQLAVTERSGLGGGAAGGDRHIEEGGVSRPATVYVLTEPSHNAHPIFSFLRFRLLGFEDMVLRLVGYLHRAVDLDFGFQPNNLLQKAASFLKITDCHSSNIIYLL